MQGQRVSLLFRAAREPKLTGRPHHFEPSRTGARARTWPTSPEVRCTRAAGLGYPWYGCLARQVSGFLTRQ